MAIPILKSSNLQTSLSFYLDTLGARLLWRNQRGSEPGVAAVDWQGHELQISSYQGDGAFGSAVYFQVDDVDAVYSALLARSWKPPSDRGPVDEAPTDQTWGMRELYVRDPDGNCLRFGTPLRRPTPD
jgi:catechol 2,3-dioxygenase-like lactoylglutathione lyase family enzyme